MSMGMIRGLITLALLIAFLALIVRLVMHGKREVYRAAANLPLEDNETSTKSRQS